jgi:hypothetical protein
MGLFVKDLQPSTHCAGVKKKGMSSQQNFWPETAIEHQEFKS